MPTAHYYVYEKREDVEFGGERTDVYSVHEFRDEDFSEVARLKEIPADKLPSRFDVGDLIEADEQRAGGKLKRVDATRAPADLQEEVSEIYEEQHRQVHEYADQLGVHVDELPDYLEKPGKEIPQKYYYVNRREGDQYVLDVLRDTTLDSWGMRTTVQVDAVPERFDVGDVLVSPDASPRRFGDAETIGSASSDATEAIREAFAEFDERVRECAAEFDVDVDARPASLEDGDVILLARPDGGRELPADEYLHVTPEGFYSGGQTTDVAFDLIINYPESTLESGMAFTPVEVDDEYLSALRYDHARSQEVRDEPALMHLYTDDPTDHIDDLERPLYVLIDGFDDGQYYSSLYDSGGTEDSWWPGLRELVAGSTHPPQHVPRDWPYPHGGGPVPVSELYLDEDEHPEAPVAVLSRDSEPIYDRSQRNR